MKISIIASVADPAGFQIYKKIQSLLGSGWILGKDNDFSYSLTLRTERLILTDDSGIDADVILFISRHSAKEPLKCLTVHCTGNFLEAKLGGSPMTVAPAAPEWSHAMLNALFSRSPPDYRVTYEVTHHGPTDLTIPSLFVEIGSTIEEWNDPRAISAVAESVLSARPVETINLLGIGGTQYATRETEITLSTQCAFGHIIHTREIKDLTADIFYDILRKSRASGIYIDRKSLSKEEGNKLLKLTSLVSLPVFTGTELLMMRNITWDTFKKISIYCESVAPGSHAVINEIGEKSELTSFILPEDLLYEALNIDRTSVIDGFKKIPLAHLVDKDGKILAVFITHADQVERVKNELINLCVKTIIAHREVKREGDYLVIVTRHLDADKAQELGVRKGPLMRDLKDGRSVNINGREITPKMVEKVLTKKILMDSRMEQKVHE